MDNVAVLGPTGALGKAIVDKLFLEDIDTKILLRDEAKHKKLYVDNDYPAGIGVVYGDIDSNTALATLLEDVDTIFACFNTQYQYWKTDMPRWISRISDLAAALEARVIFPGNIYNFGFGNTKNILETDVQDSHTEKGQIRIALEKRLMRASLEGANLTIIRLPDLYGPSSFNSVLSDVFMSAINQEKATWYGNPLTTKEFMFTEDAANVLIQVAKKDSTIDQVIHFPGLQTTPNDFINLVYDGIEISYNEKYSIIPKYKILFKSIYNKQFRQLKELLYLYDNPMTMNGNKFNQIFGKLKLTSHKVGVQRTMDWYKKWMN